MEDNKQLALFCPVCHDPIIGEALYSRNEPFCSTGCINSTNPPRTLPPDPEDAMVDIGKVAEMLKKQKKPQKPQVRGIPPVSFL